VGGRSERPRVHRPERTPLHTRSPHHTPLPTSAYPSRGADRQHCTHTEADCLAPTERNERTHNTRRQAKRNEYCIITLFKMYGLKQNFLSRTAFQPADRVNQRRYGDKISKSRCEMNLGVLWYKCASSICIRACVLCTVRSASCEACSLVCDWAAVGCSLLSVCVLQSAVLSVRPPHITHTT
jgi:hypothetical protein